MAMIVTMRPKLPWPFSKVEVLEWSYEWVREGLATLLSLKGPLPHAAGMQSTEKVVTDGQHSESVKEVTVSGAVTAPDPAQPDPAPAVPLAPSGIDRP